MKYMDPGRTHIHIELVLRRSQRGERNKVENLLPPGIISLFTSPQSSSFPSLATPLCAAAFFQFASASTPGKVGRVRFFPIN
jgi:hypothetical protein